MLHFQLARPSPYKPELYNDCRCKIQNWTGSTSPPVSISRVDPEFNNTEEWYQAIPEEVRPKKQQPFYHLYAENDQTVYEAYVSEQNLVAADCADSLRHPKVKELFKRVNDGQFEPLNHYAN